jgi:hypothetical protein
LAASTSPRLSPWPPSGEWTCAAERVQLRAKRCDTAIGPINEDDFTLPRGCLAQQHVAVLGVQMAKGVREHIERV